MKPPSARAVFGNLVEKSWFYNLLSSRGAIGIKPGQAVLALNDEDREALSKLKSDDIKNKGLTPRPERPTKRKRARYMKLST